MKKIALVTPDVLGIIKNGGVGTSFFHLATLLVESGYSVDLIYASLDEVPEKWITFYRNRGITLRGLPQPNVDIQSGHGFAKLSYWVYDFLKDLEYDLIVFPDMTGLAYFSLLARRQGLSFQNTPIVVKFLGPLTWSKEDNKTLFSDSSELSIPMLERKSVELADLVQFATPWSREWCKSKNWMTPENRTVLFPFAKPKSTKPVKTSAKIKEVIFFGRLEYRKGLQDFLQAIEIIKEKKQLDFQVTFLGQPARFNNVRSDKYLERWSTTHEIKIKYLGGRHSFEAIDYLKGRKDALTVIASHSETMGFTLLECLSNNVPVICSRIEPFATLIGELGAHGFFQAKSPESLAEKIIEGRAFLGHEQVVQLHSKTQKDWLALIEHAISIQRPSPAAENAPRISVLITHFNRAHFLDEALQSLFAQTQSPLEILVYDDKSPSDQHLNIIKKWQPRFASKSIELKFFQGTENRGPGFGRNELSKQASGDFLLFMDDDNTAKPNEIEKLSIAQLHSDADVITIPLHKIIHGQESFWKKTIWLPIGFDPNCALFENIMGDTNFLIRKSYFEKIGGFTTDVSLRIEDMNILLKATLQGAKMFVCPEPLVNYRVHGGNRSKRIDSHFNQLHAIRNGLERMTGFDMTAMSHLLLSWNHRNNLIWMDDEPAHNARTLLPTEKRKEVKLNRQLETSKSNVQISKVSKSWHLAKSGETCHLKVRLPDSLFSRLEGRHLLMNVSFSSLSGGTINSPDLKFNLTYGAYDVKASIPFEKLKSPDLHFSLTGEDSEFFIREISLVPLQDTN